MAISGGGGVGMGASGGGGVSSSGSSAGGGGGGGAAMAVGAGIQIFQAAFSAYLSARLSKATAEYNSAIIQANNKIQQAAYKFEVKRQRARGAKLVGAQRSAYAKAGVRFRGSPVDVMVETVKQIELDVFTTEFNAEASSFRASMDMRQQNYMARQFGRDSKVQPWVQGINTLASNVISTGAEYYKGKDQSGEYSGRTAGQFKVGR